MRYTWDFKKINDNYNETYKMLNQAKDEKEKEFYKKELLNLKFLLSECEKRKNKLEFTTLDGKDDVPLFYEEYIPLIKPFYEQENVSTYIDLLTGCYEHIYGIDTSYKHLNKQIAIDNDTYVGITLDYIKKSFPDYTYKIVTDIFNNNPNFLNIRYSKKEDEFESSTYIGNRVGITRHNTLNDLRILPHELMHYMYNSPKNIKDSDSKFILETEGILGDLLFAEYYKKNYKRIFPDYEECKDFFKTIVLNNLLVCAESFIVKNELLSSVENEFFNQDIFNERMTYYDIVDTENDYYSTVEYLSDNPSIDLKYGISTLVALDLFYIAKTDIDKALFLLRRLKNEYEMDNILPHLQRNKITFFEDNYKNLKRYTKNMTNI